MEPILSGPPMLVAFLQDALGCLSLTRAPSVRPHGGPAPRAAQSRAHLGPGGDPVPPLAHLQKGAGYVDLQSGCLVYVEAGRPLSLECLQRLDGACRVKVNCPPVEAVARPDGLSGPNTRYKINLVSDKTSLSFN